MHGRPTVYLAGPILDCSKDEANDWRHSVADMLRYHDILCISPLRCEPEIEGSYKIAYDDPRFGTPRAIAAKNRFDVLKCDATLAYLPTPPAGRTQSYGTLGELFWADAYGKTTILVSDDPRVMAHPVIDAAARWKLDNLAQACDVLAGVLGAYGSGRNV